MSPCCRVRMYRPGFGDCFLLSFGTSTAKHHVLIDFGAHVHGDIGTLPAIMDDVERVTGKRLELLVATHAHRDHISGFGQFADRFARFQIGEVWMPWTDDPNSPDAAALEAKHLALYDKLEQHLRFALGASDGDPRYAAALDALSNLRGNEPARSALRNAFGTGAQVRYLGAGSTFSKLGDATGLSAELLGPPTDKSFFSRMNPPADQRFLTAPGEASDAVHPFPRLEIKSGEPDYDAIVEEKQPLVREEDYPLLHELAEAPADRLALAMDNYRNNTSLVILFRYRNKSLLFPGDAQWGNWQSWIGTDRAHHLLGELDFLKVAHHGSENATPVDVVSALRASGLAVMVPTQIKPFPTIPRLPLLEELQTHSTGQVAVRSDWIDVTGAPTDPAAKPRLPKGFKAGKPGEVWIDYQL